MCPNAERYDSPHEATVYCECEKDHLLPDMRHKCRLSALCFHLQSDFASSLTDFRGGGGFDFAITRDQRVRLAWVQTSESAHSTAILSDIGP